NPAIDAFGDLGDRRAVGRDRVPDADEGYLGDRRDVLGLKQPQTGLPALASDPGIPEIAQWRDQQVGPVATGLTRGAGRLAITAQAEAASKVSVRVLAQPPQHGVVHFAAIDDADGRQEA